MTSASKSLYKSKIIADIILSKKPMHRKYLTRAINNLSEHEKKEMELYISFLIKNGLTFEYISESYLTIIEDAFTEELYFRKTGKYRHSTFIDVENSVYNNNSYMHRYMIGQALSTFWWPNHTKMRRFFQQHLPKLSEKRGGLYREIGPGHGMYFIESMKNCNFKSYEGIDISPTCVEMTRTVIESGFFGNFPNAKIIQADFLEAKNMQRADVLVMGEVLEHVENPSIFLKKAHETTTKDSMFFMTTCINAPAIDHLYNPESIENLEDLILNHDFIINDRCIMPRDGATLEECKEKKLAINLAYLLSKP